jgi:class 3 adenylate cyclase/tetratricopeptide (TPR) repeat protein
MNRWAIGFAVIGLFLSGLVLPIEGLAQQRPSNDSLLKLANNPTTVDSLKINALNSLASYYLMVRPDSTRFFALQMLENAEKAEDSKNTGEAFRLLAISSTFMGQQKEALDYISKCVLEFEKAGLKDNLRSAIANWASIEASFGDYRSAIRHHQQSLKMALGEHDTMGVASSLLNLGVVYEKLKENALAERNYKAALSLFIPINDKTALGNLYNNLAVVNAAQKKYALAMNWYRRGLSIAKQINDLKLELTITNNIGFVHLETAQYDSAIIYQQNALEGRTAIHDILGMAECYIGLGEIHVNTNEAQKALTFLEKGLNLADTVGSFPLQADAHKWLYKAHKKLGNSEKALYHYETNKTLLDSIQQEEIRQSLISQQYQLEFAQQEASYNQEKIRSNEAIRRRNQQIAGLGIIAVLFIAASVVFYRQRIRIQVEQQKSESLLLNILPAATAQELKETGKSDVQTLQQTTVLFSDFVGFTELSSVLSPHELIHLLNQHFTAFDEIMKDHGLEKIKTIGDAYMAAAGVPNALQDHAFHAAKAALAMRNYVQKVYAESSTKPAFQIRIGLHSGPVIAGIVGTQKFQYDIWGETVNKASRMESTGVIGQVNVSEETQKLLYTHFELSDRGEIETKGLGKQRMYLLLDEKTQVL